ncbi:hypothetical protein LPJ72_002406 [Coemansia sp. Benny D160-2]|nr:hypothetical protein LPJ72_002406 [Coemansia sp. Benny D160-2]
MATVVDPEPTKVNAQVRATGSNTSSSSSSSSGGVATTYKFLDYRTASTQDGQDQMPSLLKDIVGGITTRKALAGTTGPEYRSLPTVLLYDDRGLELYDRITYTPEYYPAASEIDILETKIQEIVAEIPNDSDVIELGCGSLRKTKILLDALNKQRTGVTYYAIDVMPQPLHDSMEGLSPQMSNVSFVALCGTYEEVMSHFKKSSRRKTIVWLGSSMGNCTYESATEMLSGIVDSVMNKQDSIMIGMDLQKEPSIIMDAYHDAQGVTAAFELNALSHASNIVAAYAQAKQEDLVAPETRARSNGGTPKPFIDINKFEYFGEYDEVTGRHNAFLEARENMLLQWPESIRTQVKEVCGNSYNIVLKRGERIYIESSHKYGPNDAKKLADATGLTYAIGWLDSRKYYSLNLFRKP